ncbi:MAG: multiprotein-bridging factor 1 family protein [Salinibacter sp.]
MPSSSTTTEQLRPENPFAVMSLKGLARRARDVRMDAGVSQLELAQQLGVDRSAISKAEHYGQGDGFTELRKQIIEELTGSDVKGPLYQV